MEQDKQLKIRIDAETQRALNVKTAQESVTISDVLRAAIADYLTGKYQPKIGDKTKVKAKGKKTISK